MKSSKNVSVSLVVDPTSFQVFSLNLKSPVKKTKTSMAPKLTDRYIFQVKSSFLMKNLVNVSKLFFGSPKTR